MKKLFKNSHWSTEDKLLAGAAVVAGVGIFLVMKQKVKPVATAGLRGLRGLGTLGLGEYFTNPVNGLGAYYNEQRFQAIKGLGAYRGR